MDNIKKYQYNSIQNIWKQKMRPTKYRKDKTPIFISKLYRIVSDTDNLSIVTWTQDYDGFIILDLNRFTKEVLPKYFKHSNYNSFVRQLNMYNFNKMRYSVDGILFDHVYQHQLFLKDEPENFKNIRRKQTTLKCQSLMTYGNNDQHSPQQQQLQGKQLSVIEKLKDVKQKQQKLQEFCFQLISQNQVLLAQNQQLAHKVKKESKKKEKILEQVFRIVGVSIAEFWDEFCQETETIQEKTNNFKQIYQILMSFIQNNDLNEIFKTLEFFIAPKGKAKIFKVVNSVEQANFLSNYSEEEVEEFISQTNLILQPENTPKCTP